MEHHATFFDTLAGYFGHDMHEAAGGTTSLGHPVTITHVVSSAVIALLIVIASLAVMAKLKNPDKSIVPEGKFSLYSFFEILIEATYNMLADMMGKKNAKFFLPLIGTCAIFILISNSMGLVPGLAPPTDNFRTTLALGAVIFVVTHIFGIQTNGAEHILHLFGPPELRAQLLSPKTWPFALLNVLLFPIEIISHLVRPLSLAIRLAANMFGDHLVVTMILGLLIGAGNAIVGAEPDAITIPGVAVTVAALPIYLLGCIVVAVQALVFCLLSAIYIAGAVEDHSHH